LPPSEGIHANHQRVETDLLKTTVVDRTFQETNIHCKYEMPTSSRTTALTWRRGLRATMNRRVMLVGALSSW
jgi:hypothetical protein